MANGRPDKEAQETHRSVAHIRSRSRGNNMELSSEDAAYQYRCVGGSIRTFISPDMELLVD